MLTEKLNIIRMILSQDRNPGNFLAAPAAVMAGLVPAIHAVTPKETARIQGVPNSTSRNSASLIDGAEAGACSPYE